MQSIAAQVQLALPHLSMVGHTVLTVLAPCSGRVPSADALAMVLGFANRFRLGRALRREGLPQLEELSGWLRVLSLLAEGERTRQPLYRLAMKAAENPPTWYRLIRRVTGRTWCQARAEGFDVLLVRFVRRCGEVRRDSSTVAPGPRKETVA
jgi:hypothetical protein